MGVENKCIKPNQQPSPETRMQRIKNKSLSCFTVSAYSQYQVQNKTDEPQN
jgi:hypothetical protein